MLDPRQLLDEVIAPVLTRLDADSVAARKLMLGTALAESGLRHIRQLGGGPALGLWQMEPKTHEDIWQSFLRYRDTLAAAVEDTADLGARTPSTMTWNLRYACAMARVHYMRVQEALPSSVERQATYWKQYYNTPMGQGTVTHYLNAWRSAEC